MDYYPVPMLVDEKPNNVIIHIGSNDITKLNYHTISADESAKWLVNIGLKCKYYGVGQIAISSIFARTNYDLNKIIKQLIFFSRSLCKAYDFAFICNENIDRFRLWRDGIHLTNEGTSLLSRSFLEHLNSFFHQNMDFNENSVNKTWLHWQPNKTKQPDNEKSHWKKNNESHNFIPEVMKIFFFTWS